MKKIYPLAFFVFCGSCLFAQSELAISAGSSIPVGDFSSTEGGVAQPGFVGTLFYVHAPHEERKLRTAAMVRYQSNSIDKTAFAKILAGSTVSATNWTSISVLIGPVLKLKVSEKSAFEPRFLLGYTAATSPDVTITSGASSVKIKSDNAGTFGVVLGTDFKLMVSKRASLIAGIDYFSANPKFTLGASGSGGNASNDATQQMSALNISVGMSFKLK